jgi:signal transduction histidine kinase
MIFGKYVNIISGFFLMSILTLWTMHANSENCRNTEYQINGKVDSLVLMFQTSNNEATAAHYAFLLGEYYWFERQIIEAEKWFSISLSKENQPNNTNDVINALVLLTNLYHHKGDFKKAEYFANQAFEKISIIDNKRLLGNVFEIKGRIFHSLGKSEASFNYFLKADSVNMMSSDPEIRKLSVYVKLIISDIFDGQGQKDKSIGYLNAAYQSAKEAKDSTQINLCLQAIARWNITIGKLSEAKNIYVNLLKNQTRLSAKLYSYQGLGEIHFLEKNYTQAITNFSQVIDIAKKTNELYMLDVFYHDMAKTFFAKNDLVKSKIYLDSCIYHKGSNLSNKMVAYELKSKILETQKDYKGALESIKTKNIIQDSLNRQNIATLTNQLDAANSTKEKDSRILSLEHEKTVAEAVNEKNSIIKYLLLVIILISAFVFYMIYTQMKKKKIIEQQKAIQEEQNRISAELHDDIGSTLSSISVYSELASKYHASSPDKSKEMVEKISKQSTELMTRIEDIIWSLKPKSDVRFNFKNKIKDLAGEHLHVKSILFEIEISDQIEEIINEPKLRKNLLLIIKEAIQNIAKHSEASEAMISITIEDSFLIVSIKDNGIGIKGELSKSGNGLINMRKRVSDLNARFDLVSDSEKGTKIICTIPLDTCRPHS